ncbi:histidine phosphatase family protein [Nocardioides sp.]|uniref:histidine phosphatase family protein n=1 Tax=Nocardioides sp. TaxID=35761 RepID=UPI003D0EE3EA
MATAILVRHGRTTANATGVLAGRTTGVKLDEVGRQQASTTAERLGVVPLAAVVTSPLERCRQTAAAIVGAQATALKPSTDRGLLECDYGDWQGEQLKVLVKHALWPAIQSQPSSVTFPGGESMVAMSSRAISSIRRHDAAVAAEHGDQATWVAVSHGDVIKAIVADALGMHLDLFQRINIDPASVTIIRYTSARPYVLSVNTHAGDLSWLRPAPPTKGKGRSRSRAKASAPTDAVVGGGAGPVPASA